MPKLCLIPGDGIGKEVIPAAALVLLAVTPSLEIITAEAGWECFQKRGVSVPDETFLMACECGASLFGAVSSPSSRVAGYRSSIIALRQRLECYANIRPIRSLPAVSPRSGVNLVVVRENTEGLYSGKERMEENGNCAIAERVITRQASLRIAQCALNLAVTEGREKVTIVHKANILPLTDGLFRDCVLEVASEQPQFKELEIDQLLVDTATFMMVSEPQRYDLIVTTNLFGDILSDVAAYWGGGLGYSPSLNLGEQFAIAEPVHGSAPDIAGKGIANPIAAILSGALLLRHYWNMPDLAYIVESAVEKFLGERYLQKKQWTTNEITRAILEKL